MAIFLVLIRKKQSEVCLLVVRSARSGEFEIIMGETMNQHEIQSSVGSLYNSKKGHVYWTCVIEGNEEGSLKYQDSIQFIDNAQKRGFNPFTFGQKSKSPDVVPAVVENYNDVDWNALKRQVEHNYSTHRDHRFRENTTLAVVPVSAIINGSYNGVKISHITRSLVQTSDFQRILSTLQISSSTPAKPPSPNGSSGYSSSSGSVPVYPFVHSSSGSSGYSNSSGSVPVYPFVHSSSGSSGYSSSSGSVPVYPFVHSSYDDKIKSAIAQMSFLIQGVKSLPCDVWSDENSCMCGYNRRHFCKTCNHLSHHRERHCPLQHLKSDPDYEKLKQFYRDNFVESPCGLIDEKSCNNCAPGVHHRCSKCKHLLMCKSAKCPYCN